MKLLELRKQHNKSQQEIAELLEMRQNNYSKYELGNTPLKWQLNLCCRY